VHQGHVGCELWVLEILKVQQHLLGRQLTFVCDGLATKAANVKVRIDIAEFIRRNLSYAVQFALELCTIQAFLLQKHLQTRRESEKILK
jgi:hypothetical protein